MFFVSKEVKVSGFEIINMKIMKNQIFLNNFPLEGTFPGYLIRSCIQAFVMQIVAKRKKKENPILVEFRQIFIRIE